MRRSLNTRKVISDVGEKRTSIGNAELLQLRFKLSIRDAGKHNGLGKQRFLWNGRQVWELFRGVQEEAVQFLFKFLSVSL